MARTEKTDSLGLNHWKLCDKCKSFIVPETLDELSVIARINSSRNDIFDRRPRCSRCPQTRYINPAIYVEPLNLLKSNIHRDSKLYLSLDTYRCGFPIPSQSSKRSFTSKSKSFHTLERRCKIDDQSVVSIDNEKPEVERYYANGNKIIKLSKSLSHCTLSQYGNGISASKKQAYDEWIRKKKHDILKRKKESDELELRKKIEEERLKQEKKEREKLEHHKFLKWIEKKRKENLLKRLAAEKEFKLKLEVKEMEAKTASVKETFLKQWHLRKERERKAQKKKDDLKMQQLQEEYRRKLEDNIKAFKNWQEKAKNRPRPATQGLLPFQQAKPIYINPIPWVIDEVFSEINESQIINNEVALNPVKSNMKKVVVQQ